MKKDIEKTIEIPEGVEIDLNEKEIVVKSNGKEIKRNFDIAKLDIKKEGRKIKITSKNASKKELKMVGTTVAHVNNMISGLQEDFVYKMEICNVHFPMNVKVEGNKLIIKTFLGETVNREAKILPNVNVEVKRNEITISSFDKEAAGQTAANIEKASRVKGRDRRVFQDGIFLVEKCGRKI